VVAESVMRCNWRWIIEKPLIWSNICLLIIFLVMPVQGTSE